jgi:Na+:H+ antiporter, NhaA family
MAPRINPILLTIRNRMNGGTVLLFTTLLALIIANSPLKGLYFELFEHTSINIDFGFWHLNKSLHHWINDGLMAIFFFHIGLEIKRELIIGELSSPKKALVPFIAAFGGMVVPASIYALININNPENASGWAIPMATDIAFALGILAVLGKRVPIEVKILLTSLAIVDDLGAVLTIAIFYTDTISLGYLFISLASWLVLFAVNKAGVRIFWVYLVIGIFMVWYPMLKSGVHATVAGVLLAFTIPIERRCSADIFVAKTKQAISDFIEYSRIDRSRILSSEQYASVEVIRRHCELVASPLQRLEQMLHDFSIYVIMPIFAFANTGVDFSSVSIAQLTTSPLTYGIVFGLVAGKVIGIVGFLWLFARLKIIARPCNTTRQQILGAGFLAGIGFTMSIFISDLAFKGSDMSQNAKISVFIASLVSGAIGYIVLLKTKNITDATDNDFWNSVK